MADIINDLHRQFDHSALKADTDDKTVRKLCDDALKYNFFGICVNPIWVKLAAEILRGSDTHVVSTVGFPLGANRSDIKLSEASKAVTDGASEIDIAANFGWIKSKEFKRVENEISEVRKSIPFNVVLKAIIEAPLLDSKQQAEATKAVVNGGAQFVKTGTGFSGEVSIEQVQMLFKASNQRIQVKAAGGIRTLEQCRKLLGAGASRLGSSACVQIMKELKGQKSA